jgi:hypothetical protein
MPAAGAEQPALAILGKAGRVDVGAQSLGERVVTRHAVLLAAFFVQSDRPTGAARPQILDLHIQRRANPRERVGEGGDQGPVAHITQRHVWDRPAHRRGGIVRNHLAEVATSCGRIAAGIRPRSSHQAKNRLHART